MPVSLIIFYFFVVVAITCGFIYDQNLNQDYAWSFCCHPLSSERLKPAETSLTLTRDNSASVSVLYAFMSVQAEQTDREDWCPKSWPCPDLDEGNGHAARDKAGQRRVWGAGWSASNNGVRALRPQATQRPEIPPPSHSHIAIELAFHTGLWTAIQSNYCLTWPLAYRGIKMSLAGCI